MTAPDVVLETHSGRTIALRDADTRWTVLVFEPEPDHDRLREIEALRTNFVAEDAALVVVAPTPLERSVPSVIDDGELAAAFGTAAGPATFVLDPRGTVHDAHHGTGGEYVALALLQALRIGSPSLRLVEAARAAHIASLDCVACAA